MWPWFMVGSPHSPCDLGSRACSLTTKLYAICRKTHISILLSPKYVIRNMGAKSKKQLTVDEIPNPINPWPCSIFFAPVCSLTA